jgi:uncharacterized protein (TIGR02996 family)
MNRNNGRTPRRYAVQPNTHADPDAVQLTHALASAPAGETDAAGVLADRLEELGHPAAHVLRRIFGGEGVEGDDYHQSTLGMMHGGRVNDTTPGYFPVVGGGGSGAALGVQYLHLPTGHWWRVMARSAPGEHRTERRSWLVPTTPEEVDSHVADLTPHQQGAMTGERSQPAPGGWYDNRLRLAGIHPDQLAARAPVPEPPAHPNAVDHNDARLSRRTAVLRYGKRPPVEAGKVYGSLRVTERAAAHHQPSQERWAFECVECGHTGEAKAAYLQTIAAGPREQPSGRVRGTGNGCRNCQRGAVSAMLQGLSNEERSRRQKKTSETIMASTTPEERRARGVKGGSASKGKPKTKRTPPPVDEAAATRSERLSRRSATAPTPVPVPPTVRMSAALAHREWERVQERPVRLAGARRAVERGTRVVRRYSHDERAAFEAGIDADPTDWQNHVVYADWLQDRDDPDADFRRAMGEWVRKRPAYAWRQGGTDTHPVAVHNWHLPDWVPAPPPLGERNGSYFVYPTYRDMEGAFRTAFNGGPVHPDEIDHNATRLSRRTVVRLGRAPADEVSGIARTSHLHGGNNPHNHADMILADKLGDHGDPLETVVRRDLEYRGDPATFNEALVRHTNELGGAGSDLDRAGTVTDHRLESGTFSTLPYGDDGTGNALAYRVRWFPRGGLVSFHAAMTPEETIHLLNEHGVQHALRPPGSGPAVPPPDAVDHNATRLSRRMVVSPAPRRYASRDPHGFVPAEPDPTPPPAYTPYAWPGGYPLVHWHEESGTPLCAGCANEFVANNPEETLHSEPHYEGPPMTCGDCGVDIESAYGDPDAEEHEPDGPERMSHRRLSRRRVVSPSSPKRYAAYRVPAGGGVNRGTSQTGGQFGPDMQGAFMNPPAVPPSPYTKGGKHGPLPAVVKKGEGESNTPADQPAPDSVTPRTGDDGRAERITGWRKAWARRRISQNRP